MNEQCRIELFEKMCAKFGVVVDVEKLKDMGFFTIPSSVKYHGSYEGGNFDHSFAVAEYLIALTEAGVVQWQNPRSPWVVGIFHDLCKYDQYVFDTATEKWDYSNSEVLLGHGDKSVIKTMQLLPLTEEEILCIRYHMGAYVKEDWDGLRRAIKQYPSVLWAHTADMYVATVQGK